MRLTSLIAVLSLAAASFAAACRSDSNNTTTDGPGSGSNGSGSTTTVKDIQSESMVPGTAVTLNNVVVTAVDTFGDKTGDMWVEDMGGGKRSGVHVFKGTVASGTVSVGDVVNITGGIKAEFALTGSNADNTGRTTTELEPASSSSTMTVTKTGATATITPDKVDALAIGQMYDGTMSALGGGAAFTNAWEDWEGVLVELDNVSAATAAKTFSKATPTPVDSFALKITGVAKMEGTMTDISMIPYGACFGQLTGVVDYFYDYLVLPRTAADFNTTGTACPAPEAAAGTSPGTCTDTIDNDGNGFTDCNDLGCETGSNAWLGATCTTADAVCGCSKNTTSGSSVHTVNTTQATASSPVILRDVYITAINGTFHYWVADTLQAAASNGVLVFSSPPTGATVGQKITMLQGIAGPFGSGTLKTLELSNATASTPGVGGVVLPLTGIATDTLTSATAGAPYMGSLVTLTKAKVTALANSVGEVELTDTAGKKIFMDDDAFSYYGGTSSTPAVPAALNACIIVTGVMDANTKDLIRTINPRSTTDIVTSAGC